MTSMHFVDVSVLEGHSAVMKGVKMVMFYGLKYRHYFCLARRKQKHLSDVHHLKCWTCELTLVMHRQHNIATINITLVTHYFGSQYY